MYLCRYSRVCNEHELYFFLDLKFVSGSLGTACCLAIPDSEVSSMAA